MVIEEAQKDGKITELLPPKPLTRKKLTLVEQVAFRATVQYKQETMAEAQKAQAQFNAIIKEFGFALDDKPHNFSLAPDGTLEMMT